MNLNISKALRLTETPRVAFVGAGGKTSALISLALDLPKPLVVSVTTHLGIWQTEFADKHIILNDDFDWETIEENLSSGIILITQKPNGNRLPGLSVSQLKKVYDICERHNLPLLLECDGSRQLPLKAPGDNEPTIPEFIKTVVVVAGLSGLGKSLDNNTVYNSDIFSKLGNIQLGAEISRFALENVIGHHQGGLKNIPKHAMRILLINQADSAKLQIQAGKIAKKLQDKFNGIIVADLGRGRIHAVFESTAAIILAAGSSSRFGQSKQLLDYHGIPFIKSVALAAINAGLFPIEVITGANANKLNEVLNDISTKINITFNPNWQKGQSTSIQAGLVSIDNDKQLPSQSDGIDLFAKNPGSVIFLLADQPQVTPMVLRRLMEEHIHTLAPILAPMVNGRRANPVLFDRQTFPELMKLEGDVGGRGIFSKYSPVYIEWNDFSLGQDVDNPADYERLLNE